jgi:HAD superfamily hydrolase (TIGR01490 family)
MPSSSKSTEAEPAAAQAAAFFDLDKTLMAGSSGMVWARVSYDAGGISRRLMARWALDHLRYRLRGSSDEAAAQVMAEVQELLRGTEARELERLGPLVLAGVLPRIYPEMLDEVHAHQDAGRATFIVSAAGVELVEMLARVLGMDGGIGTRYAVDAEGRFTGDLDGPFMYGEGKLTALRRFADDHDLDLATSFAYSDSASDLPMLRAVGNPVVVNPDEALLAVARGEGWQVMTFEKLGRRLMVAAAALGAVAVGGLGSAMASRRRASSRVRARRGRAARIRR